MAESRKIPPEVPLYRMAPSTTASGSIPVDFTRYGVPMAPAAIFSFRAGHAGRRQDRAGNLVGKVGSMDPAQPPQTGNANTQFLHKRLLPFNLIGSK